MAFLKNLKEKIYFEIFTQVIPENNRLRTLGRVEFARLSKSRWQ
jgi:hypothetical protein